MESVFATIWMALRGSTTSFTLSFLRTQSGANLEPRQDVSDRHHNNTPPSPPHAAEDLPGRWAGLTRRRQKEEASVDGGVHLLLDERPLGVLLVLPGREAVKAADPLHDPGQVPHLLEREGASPS